MTQFNANPVAAGDEAVARFALALAASLAFHLALILGVQVKLAQRPGNPPPVMEVRVERQGGGAGKAGAPSTGLSGARLADEEEKPERHQKKMLPQPVMSASPIADKTVPLSPALEMPLIEDPTWYPAKQVDVHPTALHPIMPVYPDQAAEQGVEGSVVLLLLIDEAGAVKEASVVEANPEGYFEESTLAAFRSARFAPAQKNGRAVKSRVLIKVSYQLNAGGRPALQPPLPATTP